MLPKKIVAATNNKSKLKELNEILSINCEVLSLNQMNINVEVEETGETFKENALLKAREIFKITNLPTIADDSGLCVEALNNAPGVFSARYANMMNLGLDNIDTLLYFLKEKTNRKAYFICCIAYIDESGKEYTVEGFTHGEILYKREGENGFGYDPIFYSYELKKSFGIAADCEKNNISHRGKALQKLLEYFKK